MIYNDHSKLKGSHAFLSASKYHWLNYDADKLVVVYNNLKNQEMGTKLHEFAATCIDLGQHLPDEKKTINMYVNDAIGYKMRTEQILYYSDNCYGTADAICFRRKFLRIHDYKSGFTPAHMEQLDIYAALFCLEYKMKPENIHIELRIYQNDEVIIREPDPQSINFVMEKIILSDKILKELKFE